MLNSGIPPEANSSSSTIVTDANEEWFAVNGNTGAGAYAISITGLSPSTLYYIRAFATNSAGTGYG